MRNKECVVNRMYTTKQGELCVSLKFKLGEVLPSEELRLRDFWRDGTPCDLIIEEFQFEEFNPNQNND